MKTVMDSTVMVAIISFAGTLIGTAGGIIASGKLTQYRLEQLEKKVDSHTNATAKIPVIEEKIADTSGKRDSYYFVLDYGGEKTTLKINGRTYRIFETGDTVTVTTYEGFLGDEYVTVSE